jgi:hypothetical protein
MYNTIFTNNYGTLLKFAAYDADRVHDCFIKVYQRLREITFTAHTETEMQTQLITYTKTAIYNTWKTEKRLEKNTVIPEECKNELEYKLLEEEAMNEDNMNHQQQLQYISEKLFEYIKFKYLKDWTYVFVTYYLYDSQNKKITYAELSKITGFSISKCCNIIKSIKQDLKDNLIQYVNK